MSAVNSLVRGCSQFAKQLPATAPVGPLQYAMKVDNAEGGQSSGLFAQGWGRLPEKGVIRQSSEPMSSHWKGSVVAKKGRSLLTRSGNSWLPMSYSQPAGMCSNISGSKIRNRLYRSPGSYRRENNSRFPTPGGWY